MERILSEVSFAGRQSALKQKKKTHEQILPFVTTYHPRVKNLKNILMHKWGLIQNQPFVRTIFKKPSINISCKGGKSFKDMLVRAKLWRDDNRTCHAQTKIHDRESVQACHYLLYLRVLPRENLWCDWLGTPGTEMLKADQSQSRFGKVQVNRLTFPTLWKWYYAREIPRNALYCL